MKYVHVNHWLSFQGGSSQKMIRSFLVVSALCIFFPFLSLSQVVTVTAITPVCNNDGVLVASHSYAPGTDYNYYWYTNDGAVTHFVSSYQTDTLYNFKGGPVSVYVLPLNGIQGIFGQDIFPFPFNVVPTFVPDTCPLQTGAVILNVTGGVAPLTYSWTMNGLPFGGNTSSITNLISGYYDCLISDASGCQMYLSDISTDSSSMTQVNVYSVNNMSLSLSTTPANCTNGTATVVASGGTAPYAYLWSNGQTTTTATGLLANNLIYVRVTDANNCIQNTTTYVQTTVQLQLNSSITPSHCSFNDGAITIIPTGGTSPYIYLWNTSDVTASISNIPTGNYQITVTDAQGCVGNGYFFVNSLTPINVNYSTTPSQCIGATGSAIANVTGGIPPYSYEWYTTPLQTTSTATALAPGSYNFKVTDTQGCKQTGTVIIPQNTTLVMNLSTTGSVCTQNNGTATMTVGGGAQPYTYLWNTGQTTAAITNVGAGTKFATVTDALGCTRSDCMNVQYISQLYFVLVPQPASCLYTADGSISVNIINGTAPYTYQWSTGQSTASISGLLPGYYSVDITDANGCVYYQCINLGFVSINPCTATLTGQVYIDMNQDCIKTGGDPVMQNIPIQCVTTGDVDYTDANGFYSFYVPAGTIDIVQLSLPYRYPFCPATSSISVNVPSTGMTVVQDIADTVDWVNDLTVGVWNYSSPPVVGSSFIQRVVEFNRGTQLVTSTNQYDYEIQTPYNFASLVPTTFNPGISQATWDNTLALPLFQRTYDVSLSVPVSVPINTQVVYTDTIFPIIGDTTWWDNSKMIFTTTVGSYDPNYKEVTPKGIGPQGFIALSDSVLEYVIHFQNIGNYFATNIRVADQLDSDLDPTTLRVVYSTHNQTAHISPTGLLEFDFQNIYLPSIEDDSIGSNGFVVYTIHTKPNLADGTTIENSAGIYFDFNMPILTNTTLNTIQITGIDEPNSEMLTWVYPNPNQGTFTVTCSHNISGKVNFDLQNLAGQTVFTFQKVIQAGEPVDLSTDQIAPGMYFLNVHSQNQTSVLKVVIE